MASQIGKYLIFEDDKKFCISYKYTLVDFIGSLRYLVGILLGSCLVFVAYNGFLTEGIKSSVGWLLGGGGLCIFLFCLYLIIGGFYNFRKGVLLADKQKMEVTLVNFLLNKTIPYTSILSVYYELKIVQRPKQKYCVLCLKLTDGNTKECFIIRSSMPFDLERKVEKDLHTIARQIRDAITKVVTN